MHEHILFSYLLFAAIIATLIYQVTSKKRYNSLCNENFNRGYHSCARDLEKFMYTGLSNPPEFEVMSKLDDMKNQHIETPMKKFKRLKKEDSRIMGVCGAISLYFWPTVDPVFLRIFAVIFTLMFPFVGLIYLLIGLLVKREKE